MATELPRILIVDDNEDNRYTLQLLLESDGHERIVCAASGSEAIALIEKEKFSLILLDLMMPDLNGDEVLKVIRSDPDRRDIPVIMISADTEFDKLAEDVGIEKIKTIGDNYMAVAGVPTPRPNHARMAANFALDTIAATGRLRSRLPVPFAIRVGLHSGPVMAGVIGTRRFAYDLWGDTVNIAARMQAASQPNRVLASAATVKGLGSDYSFDGPHKIDNKEGRVLEAFFVGRHP